MSLQDLLANKVVVPADSEAQNKDPQPSKNIYKADRLKRYARANGVLVFPVDGYYTPECEEDELLLSYYESQNMSYVTKVM